jgi:hypothetical protein
MALKGFQNPSKGKLRPHIWKAGTDPVRHKQYLVWLQQKNQANFRDEGWTIDFDAWIKIWGNLWPNRGRERGCYCMSRIDWSLPWTLENVAIITREEHARLQALARMAGWRSIARKRELLQKADV